MNQLSQSAIDLESLAAARFAFYRRIALRHVRNVQDAEDAVQDAFLSAHRNLHQYRGDSSFSTWFGTIVINSAKMQRRRVTRLRLDPESEEKFFRDLPAAGPDPEQSALRSIETEILFDRIRALTPKLRTTMLLRVAGDSLEEISEKLDMPVGTVKAQLSRGRARIKRRR